MLKDTLILLKEKKLLEEIAKLEHEQWMYWASTIMELESISTEKKIRWGKLFFPYNKLTEKQKRLDRIWANKVIEIVKKHIKGDKNSI